MSATNDHLSPINSGDLVKDRFEIKESLGEGGFGAVFEVWDRKFKEKLALKVELERPAEDEPGLEIEIGVLKKLQNSRHVTKFKDEGRCGPLRYVIMQLVGRNLADLRIHCPMLHFTSHTTQRLALQCLEAIHEVHQIGFLHRDIKPANFAIGREKADARVVYILDFGLVRFFLDSSGQLRPQRKQTSFRGTVRYASITTHRMQELGRGDDLFSWLYMLVEMYTGELPWRKEVDKDRVGHVKEVTTKKQLLGAMDCEYSAIYEHLKTLTYEKTPDYALITKLMCLKRNKFKDSEPMDWEQGGVAYFESKTVTGQPYAAQMPEKDKIYKDKPSSGV